MFKVPNKYRVKNGFMGSDDSIGNEGAFQIPLRSGANAVVIASNKGGWEHVSVTLRGKKRCPKWEEMCEIKRLFWDHSATVMQIHPPAEANISNHDYCLHMWRPVGSEIPMPPEWMVGIKTAAA